MKKFMDLPLNLLPCILGHLSKKELNALVRVCRFLNKEVTPHLYHDIRFTATRSRGCARRLAFLLRTLLEHPQLTSHVTAFRLFGPHPCWTKYNPWPEGEDIHASPINLWGLEGCTTLSKTQTIFASNQFYQLVDEEMRKSLEQFRGRNKDALATLVLTRCTELSTLELGDGFLMYSLFLPQILKRADHLLPKLEHVILGEGRPDPENAVSYMDLDLIRPIFYSSTVRNFEWTMTQPWQFRWNSPDAPRSDSLTTLHLFRTNIHRSTLDQLLGAAPNVKRFHYDQEIPFSNPVSGTQSLSPFLNLDGLNIALANLKNTLEECRLTLRLAPGSLTPSDILEAGIQFAPIQGTLTILKDMKHLIKVEVPMVMFLGWIPDFAARLEEVLPPSITDLSLRDDFVPYCPWALGFNCNRKVGRIGEYIEGRKTHASQLKTLKIRVKPAKGDGWLADAVRDLKGPVERTGMGVQHWVVSGKRSETYCWRFKEDGGGNGNENGDDLRKDSVIPGTFLSI